MHSLADRLRVAAEWGLRAVALGLIAWCLLLALRGRPGEAVEGAEAAGLREALARWSTVATPERVWVRFAEPPAAVERDWLAALPGAGTGVSWGGTAATPSALSVERIADPAGGVHALVAAPAGATVTLGDEIGPLDSATVDGAVLRFHVGATPRALTARVAGVVASAASPRSPSLRRVLVLGRGGWEAKFVTAALEERGWKVDAHLVVSPKSDVMQGEVAALDTARHAAVLVLDTSAAPYARRVRDFAADGGGVVLWPGAARGASFAPLAAARTGATAEGGQILASDTMPRLRLAFAPLRDARPDVAVLERRGGEAAVVARRAGLGRVLQVGYEETWRWRMRGGDDAPEHHRAWISGLVASVAFTGAVVDAPPAADAAPLVAMVHRLGAPVKLLAPAAATDRGSRATATWTIFAALCAALLLEWTSRRLRGAR